MVFKEDVDIVPTIMDDSLSYMPWGGDNQMPFNIFSLIRKAKHLPLASVSTQRSATAPACGIILNSQLLNTKQEVEDFYLDNDLPAYFLGVSQDFKHFGFAFSVLILNEDTTKIVRLLGKEACYCRFAPADTHGKISKILYANWRKAVSDRSQIEVIDLPGRS